MDDLKEELELLNKALYNLLYEYGTSYIDDFHLIDRFNHIILDNKTNITQQDYHTRVPINRSIMYSYEFLKTIDSSYADKLKTNIKEGKINLYKRTKEDETLARIEVDSEQNKSTILIPYTETIEDTFTITHEQLHDTNMLPNKLTATGSVFTEMFSFLGELLQRDFFEEMSKRPKEYRKDVIDTLCATKHYAIVMNFNLQLIKIFFDKGFISYQDMHEICQGKTIEELELISDELDKILSTGELSFYMKQRYVLSNVLACHFHQLMKNNPSKKYMFRELNEIINDYSPVDVFNYLDLDVEDNMFITLSNNSYKKLEKSYAQELKRI